MTHRVNIFVCVCVSVYVKIFTWIKIRGIAQLIVHFFMSWLISIKDRRARFLSVFPVCVGWIVDDTNA